MMVATATCGMWMSGRQILSSFQLVRTTILNLDEITEVDQMLASVLMWSIL